MKLVGLFIVGLLLMLAGGSGNLGSMLGSILDPANMVDLSGGSSPTTTTQATMSQNILGGTGPHYV